MITVKQKYADVDALRIFHRGAGSVDRARMIRHRGSAKPH